MPITAHAGPRPPAGRPGTTAGAARPRAEYMQPDKDLDADDRYHGFHFRRRRDRINWRLLGAVDVARVQREIDLGALQEVMDNVAYCDIESEDLRYTDPNFVKLFQLAQLVIEYLLHCQDVLHSSDQDARRQATELAAEVDHLQQQNEKQLLEIYALKKETKSLKKTIFAYQIMTKTPGFHTGTGAGYGAVVADRSAGRVTSPIAVEFHRCKYCPKVFNSLGYLDGHLRRRHADLPHYLDDERHPTPPPPAPPAPPAPAEPDVDTTASAQADLIDRLTRTIEDFGQKLHATESQLQADMEDRLHRELAAKQAELEEAHNRDWDTWRAQVHDELEAERALIAQEREKLQELQRSIEEKQLHPPRARGSSLGPLEDDEDEVIEPVAEPKPTLPEVDLAAVVAQIEARQREGLAEMQATVAKEIQALRELMNRDQANQQVSNELKTTAQRLESLQQAILDRQVSAASFVSAPPVPPPVVQPAAPVVEAPVWQPPPPQPAPVMPPSLHGSREVLAQDANQLKTPKKPKKKPAPPALQLPLPSSAFPDDPPSFLDDVDPQFDPSQTDTYGGDCDWPIISRHLRTHKHVPLPYAPWARAAVAAHPAVSVVKERESIKVQLQRAMHQLGITREALLDEQATDALVERLERDKDEKVRADPSYGFAYELICDDVDAATDRHFRFKPKPTRLVPPRGGRFANVGTGGSGGVGGNGGTARFQSSAAAARARSRLATNSPARLILRSVLKSPDGSGRRTPSINSHLGSPGTPRRVEWKDAASDDSDSDSEGDSPKSSTSRVSRHGGAGWGQAPATPPSWRTSAGGGGTRNGGGGGKGGSWGMGGGPAHAKSRPARSSPLKQSFTASALRKPDMAGVVVDAMRAAAPATAGGRKQWNRAGSNGEDDDVPTPTAALTSNTYRPQAPLSATPTEAGMRKTGSNASMAAARPSWGDPAPPPAARAASAAPAMTVHHDDGDESDVIGDKSVDHFDVSTDNESEVAPPPAAAPVARARTITSAPVPVPVADTSVDELMQGLASDSEASPDKRKSRPPPINTRVIQSKPANNYSAWDDDEST
ncbi:Zinc finger protein dzip1 [Allomyces arbusculus]|nr:Zinc finger protein dzip1 [Allomyces arbusculus]